MTSTQGLPIPLTVIGGFLGAGKTTLVNRVLGALVDIRVAVLVNDFGRINIDARLIASRGAECIELTNGCVCCSIGDDLTEGLIKTISSRPAPQWILVEASGVSDPGRIGQVALADPALFLDGIVVLVDAECILDQREDRYLADTISRQVRAADVLIVNKCDLVPSEHLRAIRGCVANIAPGIRVVETTGADVPATLLTGANLAARAPLERAGSAHHQQFLRWSFSANRTFVAAKLWALLNSMPEGILRLKGLVRTDESSAALLQFSGRRGTLRAIPGLLAGSEVVAVGLRDKDPFVDLEARVRESLAFD